MRYSKLQELGAGLTLPGLALLLLLAVACRGTSPVSVPTPIPSPTLAPSPSPSPTPSVLELLNSETSVLLPILRRLNLSDVVPARQVSPQEARTFLERQFTAQGLRERTRHESALYAALGLIPEGLDLYRLYLDLTLEQVSGHYDPSARELLLVSQGGSVGPREVLLLAYAYGFVLQEQNFQAPALRQRVRGRRDAELALEALSQGDALLAMTQYGAGRLRSANLADLLAPRSSPALAAAPFAVRELFLFPFAFGPDFVLALHRSDGWARVDRAYTNHPISTTQVLHPAKYVGGFTPTAVDLPDLRAALGPEWRRVGQDALGEFRLRIYLGSGLAGEEAAAAAAGWQGDQYALWEGPQGAHLLVMKSAWESPAEAQELFNALGRLTSGRRTWQGTESGAQRAWWRAPDAYVSLSLAGQDVLLVLAPGEAVGRSVLVLFPGF